MACFDSHLVSLEPSQLLSPLLEDFTPPFNVSEEHPIVEYKHKFTNISFSTRLLKPKYILELKQHFAGGSSHEFSDFLSLALKFPDAFLNQISE